MWRVNADEVVGCLPYISRKYELPVELVELQGKLLLLCRSPTEEVPPPVLKLRSLGVPLNHTSLNLQPDLGR